MVHSGSFKPGNDARRYAQYLPNGRTLASLARDYTEDAVNVLVSVVKGDMADVKVSDRIRAAEILLDRGYGKAKETVQLELTTSNVTTLTRDQLRAIAAGAVIEGEATVVTTSLPPATDEEQLS